MDQRLKHFHDDMDLKLKQERKDLDRAMQLERGRMEFNACRRVRTWTICCSRSVMT